MPQNQDIATEIDMYAHYCNDRTVRITSEMRPVGGVVIKVSGKREARAIAAQYNAKPWNF